MTEILPIQQQFAQRIAASGNPGAIKIRKAPEQLYPKGTENRYTNNLVKMVNETYRMMLRKLQVLEYPMNNNSANRIDSLDIRNDDLADDIAEVMEAVRFGFSDLYPNEDIEQIARDIAAETEQYNRKQIRKVIAGMIGVDPFISEPWLERELDLFVKQNVALIKSIPDQFFNQTEEIVYRNFRNGMRYSEMVSELRGKYKVTQSRARLIARDQIGKLNGQLTELRQTSLGIKKYRWHTSRDSRVRPNHKTKDNKIFKWSNPPADTGHPGEDYQCRCWAEPILSDVIVI